MINYSSVTSTDTSTVETRKTTWLKLTAGTRLTVGGRTVTLIHPTTVRTAKGNARLIQRATTE